jgi:hypothetical protein
MCPKTLVDTCVDTDDAEIQFRGDDNNKYKHNDDDDTTIVFLTLGDGDFSWSLDLARFLSSTHAIRTSSGTTFQRKLIATGIDEIVDLTKKYRNSDYILRELKRTASHSSLLSIVVCHGVNAIVDLYEEQKELPYRGSLPKAHVVIFNHPHLGTEDAVMHSRFLCHLFHSVDKVWLTTSTCGIFYLTLAKGQYERWHCERAARSNGFQLYQRFLFKPTPLANASYEHRRHQTGKSFASRTNGSETFAFVRKNCSGNSLVFMLSLPWFQSTETLETSRRMGSNNTTENNQFECLHCKKLFAESRSLKNHILSKHDKEYHSDATTGKRMRDDSPKEYFEPLDPAQRLLCPHCTNKRDFASSSALKDHIFAKHISIHKAISAERGVTSTSIMQSFQSEPRTNCKICSAWFTDSQQEAEHMKFFVPKFEQEEEHHQCQFCLKVFREKRARLQHENFCAIGREPSNLLKTSQEHEKR